MINQPEELIVEQICLLNERDILSLKQVCRCLFRIINNNKNIIYAHLIANEFPIIFIKVLQQEVSFIIFMF